MLRSLTQAGLLLLALYCLLRGLGASVPHLPDLPLPQLPASWRWPF